MRITIGDYLILRLKELGIRHILGVPGDFNLQFLEQIRASEGLEFVGMTNELNAAYAADGYSRSCGISALAITYGVGDLAALAGVAGSSAEQVPIIVISGAPPLYVMKKKLGVHHSLGDGDFSNVQQAYDEFVVNQVKITPENAAMEIDRSILLALRTRRPVNLQLPSNISYLTIDTDIQPLPPVEPSSDPERLEAALTKTEALYNASSKPAVLVDMAVDRLGLTDLLWTWIQKTGVPYAQLSTGKAILPEKDPLFMGTYNGDRSDPGVQERIEKADFLLTVAPRFIEQNSGQFSQDLPDDKVVLIHRDFVLAGEDDFEGIYATAFMKEILQRLTEKKDAPGLDHPENEALEVEESKPLTQKDFWKFIGGFLREEDVIFGETGTSNHGLLSTDLPDKVRYVGSQIWGAIGFALPSYFGSLLADPDRRQILMIGDGSFQVTATEYSTILRHNLNPIIFLINNEGYTIERYIMGMEAGYNDIGQWQYSKLHEVMAKDSRMKSIEVRTQGELMAALKEAESAAGGIFIEVHMDRKDAPERLKEFGPSVAQFNYGPRGPSQDIP